MRTPFVAAPDCLSLTREAIRAANKDPITVQSAADSAHSDDRDRLYHGPQFPSRRLLPSRRAATVPARVVSSAEPWLWGAFAAMPLERDRRHCPWIAHRSDDQCPQRYRTSSVARRSDTAGARLGSSFTPAEMSEKRPDTGLRAAPGAATVTNLPEPDGRTATIAHQRR